MIVKQAQQSPDSYQSLTGDLDPMDVEVILPPEEGEDAEDDTSEAVNSLSEERFYENLAEDLGDKILQKIADECEEFYENDLRSRTEWSKTYEEGLELLGLNIEEKTEPWEGACGIFHPLMAESAIKFQAEAITETFSAQGVCKPTIIGKITQLREQAATRIAADMNWRMTTQMKEYRPEHERMLWNLSIAGSAFKKVYFDPALDRQTSIFVSADDLVVSYGATDMSTAPRISHRMKKSPNDIKKLQYAGFYRDIDLPDAPQNVKQTPEDKKNGVIPVKDDRLELIEMQVELEIEGYEDVDAEGDDTGIMLPYIVTFDLHSKEVLSIYRNWKIDDKTKTRCNHFVHYIYIPGFGFYGLGLVHLVGGFAKSATSILRQLIDCGTLANLPAGYKTKGIRVQRDSDPLSPGEFRDVDVPSGTLRDNLMPLPFKEPSATLLQLFNEVVEEGRRMAAVSDVNAADMNQQAPVGTTLAILERSLKVMSAIQARLHASLKEELALLKAIIKDQLPEEYDYDVDEGRRVKQADYDIADIIPVSDPNASTLSQRVVQYQMVSQMAQANPTIYDRVELDRQLLEGLGIQNLDKLIPSSIEQTPRDPIAENENVINGKPVKAYAYQDHESHLKVHQSMQQDPHIAAILGQDPNAQAKTSALLAHIAEHVAFAYRNAIEAQLGTPLPQGDEKMTPEVEKQLSATMAQAASQLLQQHQTEAAQQQAQQAAQDPVLQLQQAQLQVDKDKNRIAEKKVDNDFTIAKMKGTAEGAIHEDTQKHQKQMADDKLIADALAHKADLNAQGAPDPQLQSLGAMQDLTHKSQKHNQELAHAQTNHHQELIHKEHGHVHDLAGSQQDMAQSAALHEQKVQDAQHKRLLNAAMAAAKPHLGAD
jgi:hypothetical protein